MIIVTSFLVYGSTWVYSATLLSSVPGVWYGLTAYIISLLGIPPVITVFDAFMIYLRTTTISLAILFIASMISPVELTNLLYKIGAGEKALALQLLWRLTPLGLRYMSDSLIVGNLKGESIKYRIAPAIASLLETGWRIEEACYYRLKTSMTYKLYRRYSIKYTVLLVAVSLISLLTVILTRTFLFL